EVPHAQITISVNGVESMSAADGSGPVDATFKAIENLIDSKTKLLVYSVNNVTDGTDAQGEVGVRLEKDGNIVNGQGADTDIVTASAKAYLNALNKILKPVERKHPQAARQV
ncbi:alpha-isopropylmalate synthase regulatory domain-containing protein, partial [Thiotrichales bacterium HSG1]|nr:alpha-isopropylmalate synthase regulatory domain-containing protein [Thiotrichales bacterium HSG1]